jgi:hypothetical protein
MKNLFLIIGFIVCALASFALMSLSKSFMPQLGEWNPNGTHMRHIEASAQGMLDKCKLDRLQGRLKNHQESVSCSNPVLRDAFVKEAFPHMDKVDEFLAERLEYAKKLDNNEITEDQMHDVLADAQLIMLESTKSADPKK